MKVKTQPTRSVPRCRVLRIIKATAFIQQKTASTPVCGPASLRRSPRDAWSDRRSRFYRIEEELGDLAFWAADRSSSIRSSEAIRAILRGS